MTLSRLAVVGGDTAEAGVDVIRMFITDPNDYGIVSVAFNGRSLFRGLKMSKKWCDSVLDVCDTITGV